MRHKSVPNYSKWIKKARSSRRLNIIVCAVGCAVSIGGAAVLFMSEYRLPALLACASVLIMILGLMIKNIREVKAIMEIARTGNYAVMLSDQQQRAVAEQQARRGICFYLAAFLVISTSEAIILTVMSAVTGDEIFLLFMGALALFALMVALVAYLYLKARLSARDSFFTVSPNGILVGREVIPFTDEDAVSLYKFTDYYLLRFKKTEIFGVTHKSEIIIPTDGVVRAGTGRSADEEIVHELALEGMFATTERFFESRDYGEGDSVASTQDEPFLTDDSMDELIAVLESESNKQPLVEEE